MSLIKLPEKPNYKDILDGCQTCGNDCPWTGESRGVDWGCLPSPWDMAEHFEKTNEIYSCHENLKIPCIGIKKFFKRIGLDVKQFTLIPNN